MSTETCIQNPVESRQLLSSLEQVRSAAKEHKQSAATATNSHQVYVSHITG